MQEEYTTLGVLGMNNGNRINLQRSTADPNIFRAELKLAHSKAALNYYIAYPEEAGTWTVVESGEEHRITHQETLAAAYGQEALALMHLTLMSTIWGAKNEHLLMSPSTDKSHHPSSQEGPDLEKV